MKLNTKNKKKSKKRKRRPGRPPDYKPEYVKKAERFIVQHKEDMEGLAEVFDVTVRTLNNWMNKNPKFKAAIERGRQRSTIEQSKDPGQNGEVGRPYQYYQEYTGIMARLCARINEGRHITISVDFVAHLFGVSVQTIHNWREAIPEFKKAYDHAWEVQQSKQPKAEPAE